MIPILVEISARDGARLAELTARLGVGRETAARTLKAGLRARWIVRNPGHGHPLRPDYILTETGRDMVRAVRPVVTALSDLDIPILSVPRWSLPIVHLVGGNHNRFNDLARHLPDAGPRALSQSLQWLTAHQLLVRTLVDGRPPSSRYALSERGVTLVRSLNVV